jgi:crossover junction endodeoxyribonuclease RuvC
VIPPCVLGLDLAMTRTGYALVAEDSGRIVRVGEITTNPTNPHEQRLLHIATQVVALVDAYEPYAIFAEDAIGVGGRMRTAITIGKVHGAVLAALARRDMSVGYWSPGEIKKAATGNGNASKAEMILAARDRWDGVDISISDNEADALWCAELGRLHIERHIASLKENP